MQPRTSSTLPPISAPAYLDLPLPPTDDVIYSSALSSSSPASTSLTSHSLSPLPYLCSKPSQTYPQIPSNTRLPSLPLPSTLSRRRYASPSVDTRIGKERVQRPCSRCGTLNHIRKNNCASCKAPKDPAKKRTKRPRRPTYHPSYLQLQAQYYPHAGARPNLNSLQHPLVNLPAASPVPPTTATTPAVSAPLQQPHLGSMSAGADFGAVSSRGAYRGLGVVEDDIGVLFEQRGMGVGGFVGQQRDHFLENADPQHPHPSQHQHFHQHFDDALATSAIQASVGALNHMPATGLPVYSGGVPFSNAASPPLLQQ